MPSPAAAIPVVCALIEDPCGRVLVARRPPHKHLGLKWEFPGGKVEAGESPEAALRREIAEELGCGIDIVAALPRHAHAYEKIAIEMIPFIARLTTDSAAPEAREHVALQWVAPADLSALDLPAADGPVVADYLAWKSMP